MASTKASAVTETAADEVVNAVVDAAAKVGIQRYFTIPGRDPFEEIDWESRDALIPGKDGPVGRRPSRHPSRSIRGTQGPRLGR